MSKKERNNGDSTTTPQQKIDGIFSGLSEILGKLGDLAEKAGDQFSQVNEITRNDGKSINAIMGYNVKIGLNEKGEKKDFTVEPFGNIVKDTVSGKATVKEVLEPITDVFEEADHTLVIIELPGIGGEDVAMEVKGDIITVTAENTVKKYYKEVLLPRNYTNEQVHIKSCNNGILEIICSN